MKRILTALAFVVGGSSAFGAQAAPTPVDGSRTVVPAQRRIQVLKTADDVLVTRTPTWKAIIGDLPDPFFRANFVQPATETAPAPEQSTRHSERTGLDVLRAIAPEIKPTGAMVLGENRVLLVGGKPYKVGDAMKVTFEGLVYEVVFSSIERNSYTLQLGENELLREFK